MRGVGQSPSVVEASQSSFRDIRKKGREQIVKSSLQMLMNTDMIQETRGGEQAHVMGGGEGGEELIGRGPERREGGEEAMKGGVIGELVSHDRTGGSGVSDHNDDGTMDSVKGKYFQTTSAHSSHITHEDKN